MKPAAKTSWPSLCESKAQTPPERPIRVKVRTPAARSPSPSSRSRQPRSTPIRKPIASARPTRVRRSISFIALHMGGVANGSKPCCQTSPENSRQAKVETEPLQRPPRHHLSRGFGTAVTGGSTPSKSRLGGHSQKFALLHRLGGPKENVSHQP